MPTLEETIAFARSAHAGQIDKSGEPYFGHVERVARNALDIGRAAGLDADALARIGKVAHLHDVVEDTKVTARELLAQGHDARDVASVGLLTKDGTGRTGYAEAIAAIAASGDVVAIAVKLGDLTDNSDEDRLARLAPETARRLRFKYAPAKIVLRAAFAATLEARGGGERPAPTDGAATR